LKNGARHRFGNKLVKNGARHRFFGQAPFFVFLFYFFFNIGKFPYDFFKI